ncbi:S8 family serine peptidase [Rhizomonospora bruguierae]|uniref:S8 family serine peptidase n=1 Tax=Rhizomonospora bruguierae TaxID=1581705 RepID=UPI001BCB2896|nr:S8 family serine peptidase [Micromonospora sp. NBRC 107566]
MAVAIAAAVAAPALPAPASADAGPKPHPGQWYLSAWKVRTDVWPISQGAGVTVAIVDTGVDEGRRLPEIRGDAVLPGVDLGADEDERDDSDGRGDFNGHGTAMALLVAARGSDGGMVGLAPKATILPVRASTGNQLHAGIRWAADHGAKVINVSMSGIQILDACSPRMQSAIDYAIERDAVIVAAAGNDGNGENHTEEPASCPGVLAVGGVDRFDRAWQKTQRKPYVAVAAPGKGVTSKNIDGEIVDSNGTSDSAALVSGLAALVRARYPDASAREVVQRIIATARDVGPPGRDDTTGYGVIDPARALTAQVPADAPNPVFAAYDTQRGEQRSAQRRHDLVGLLPWAAGALCLLVAVAIVVLLLVWSIRRDRPARPTGGWSRT